MKSILKSIVCLLSMIVLASCNTSKRTSYSQKENRTPCDSAKLVLNLKIDSPELNWLDKNQTDCARIHEFLKLWGNSADSKEYINGFIKLKLYDNEYKLERFIELYCLLKQNPNALIDGTLPLEKKE